MSALRRKLPVLGVFSSAALFAFSLPASAITFPDPSATVEVGIVGPDGTPASGTDVESKPFATGSAGTPLDPGVTASATVAGNPFSTLKFSLSAVGLATSGTSNESAIAVFVALQFYFAISAPIDTTAVLGISAHGALMGTGTGNLSIELEQLDANGNLVSSALLGGACVEANCLSFNNPGPSFDLGTDLRALHTNTIYSLVLGSVNDLAEAGQTETGFIDPMFDTSLLPDGFQLELSSGVGNGASATPLPAALPLFATGLGGLGLLGWRRRRKTQAVA